MTLGVTLLLALFCGSLARPPKNPNLSVEGKAILPKLSTEQEPEQIEFITDIEGNWNYFQKFFELSEILELDNEGFLHFKAANSHLVVGGDSFDKGPGDIRIARALLDLKKKSPKRVTLIMGNRDINKLRFKSELEEGTRASDIKVYWAKHQSYEDFCKQKELEQIDSEGREPRVSILKWILACSMGAQTTFDTRKGELEVLGKLCEDVELTEEEKLACGEEEEDEKDDEDQEKEEEDENKPTKCDKMKMEKKAKCDEEVVFNSFRDSVNKGGFVLEYLQNAQLMARIGDSIFMHGALNMDVLGTIPGTRSRELHSLDKWIEKLNKWAQTQIAGFIKNPTWKKDKKGKYLKDRTGEKIRGGEALMDYALPGGNGGNTVVVSNWLDATSGKELHPNYLDEKLEDYLYHQGVRRVFTGHMPHGDSPLVIRSNRIMVMACDTSLSDKDREKSPDDPANTRGSAISLVTITPTETRVKGVLTNLGTHAFTLKTDDQDSPIGRKTKDNGWVKSYLTDEKYAEETLLVAKTITTNFKSLFIEVTDAAIEAKDIELADIKPRKPNSKKK